LETLAPMNSTGISFFTELGCRLSQNHILISASLFGGPSLQLGSLQRNLHSSYRIGLVPLKQPGFVFNFSF